MKYILLILAEEISGLIAGFGWLLIVLPFWTYHFRKTFGVFNEKGKFLHYDKAMFSDRGNFGTVAWLYLIALGVIGLVGIVFIA